MGSTIALEDHCIRGENSELDLVIVANLFKQDKSWLISVMHAFIFKLLTF